MAARRFTSSQRSSAMVKKIASRTAASVTRRDVKSAINRSAKTGTNTHKTSR